MKTIKRVKSKRTPVNDSAPGTVRTIDKTECRKRPNRIFQRIQGLKM